MLCCHGEGFFLPLAVYSEVECDVQEMEDKILFWVRDCGSTCAIFSLFMFVFDQLDHTLTDV